MLEKNNSLVLPLEAIKGKKPYIWMANDRIVSFSDKGDSVTDILWKPTNLGVNTLNVIDSEGYSDSIKVVIKKHLN